MPRISRQRACSRSKRVRASAGRPASIVTSDDGGGCGRRRRRRRRCRRRGPSRRSPRGTAESRRGRRDRSARPPRRAAAAPAASGVSAAAADAAEEEQQVPPEEKRFLQVVRHPGALRRRSRTAGRLRAARPWSVAMRQSPARVDVARLSMMSRISNTRSTNAGSRCISFGGRSGGGTSISRRIVPGDDENT